MKKATSRLLLLLVTVMALAAVMATGAFAANTIDAVTATIAEPVVGEAPAWTATTPDSDYTVMVVDWRKGGSKYWPGSKMAEGETFEAGNTYVVELRFLPKSDKVITDSTTCTINGMEGDCSGTRPEIGAYFYRVDFALMGEGTPYYIDINSSNFGYVTASASRATPGTVITLTIAPWENYELDTLTVTDSDGNEVPVTGNQFVMPDSSVLVTPTFKKIGTISEDAISTLTATIAEPVVGGTPAMTATTPDSTYTVEVVRWFKGGSKYAPGNEMAEGETFEAGYTYVASLVFLPVGENFFSTTPECTINGMSTDWSGTRPEIGAYFFRVDFTLPEDDLDPMYEIETVGDELGTVSVDLYRAKAGETITVTTSPLAKCELATLTVTDAYGNVIPVTDNQFVMPSGNVTVTATFQIKELVPITNVNATIAAPVVGENASFSATFDIATGGQGVVWYQYDTEPTMESLGWEQPGLVTSSGDPMPFVAGKYYAVNLQVLCDADHVFSAATTATVNGQPATRVDFYPSYGENYLDIFLYFGKLDGGLPFTDVKKGDWFYDDLVFSYSNGLIRGTTETTFSPNATMTRGMLVTLLYRMEGSPAAGENPFNDVAKGSYCEASTAWAASKGIVLGYGDGNFQPNTYISREQMATMLYRYAKYKGFDTSARANLSGFTDEGQVSNFAYEALQWANAVDLIRGVTVTQLDPKGDATRAQAAVIFHRFCVNIAGW